MSTAIIITIALLFLWSGFVRTSFGVDSNALMLPLALLVIPDPLFIIPLIVPQTILFCGFEVIRNRKKIAWRELGKMTVFFFPAFVAGIYGLLNFPAQLLTLMIYAITIFYAIDYVFPRKQKIDSKLLDTTSLVLGGYTAGVSFNGGPIIAAAVAKKIPRELLTNSLLAIWAISGVFKLSALVTSNVDLHLNLQLFAFPAAAVGHFIGLKFHDRIAHDQRFYRWIGAVLLLVSIVGIWRVI